MHYLISQRRYVSTLYLKTGVYTKTGEIFLSHMCVARKTSLCSATYAYAGDLALPAFVRRAPLLQKSIDISCLPCHSSKPAAVVLLLWAHIATDRRTDTVPLRRPCCSYFAAVPIITLSCVSMLSCAVFARQCFVSDS